MRSAKENPRRQMWSRTNENPCNMEGRLRDALRPSQHGAVKIFTKEEIQELQTKLDSVKSKNLV